MSATDDQVTVRLRLQDVGRFIADMKAGRLSVDQLEQKIKQAGRTARETTTRSGGFGMVTSGIRTMRYAALGAMGVLASAGVASGTFAIKATASFEQVQMAFRTMLGDKQANALLDRLQTFAASTPFEFKDLAKSSQQMLAFGFSAKSVIPTMTAIGDAMSAVGGGSEGVARVLLALGQMKMKGRVQGDELLQLAENNVNAVGYLSKALGLTKPQVLKAASQGKIAADKAIPIILGGMEKQYRGMMSKQAMTLSGIWSNLVDSVTQGAIRVTSPFLPAIKKWLKDLVDRMPEIEAWITEWINKTITGAQKGVKAVKVGVQWVKTTATRLKYDPQSLGRDAGEGVGGGIRSLFGMKDTKIDWFSMGKSVSGKAAGFILGFVLGLFDPVQWWPVIKKHWLEILLGLVFLFPVGRALGLFGKLFSKIPILRALAPLFKLVGGAFEKAGAFVWKMVSGVGRAIGRALWGSLVRVFPDVAFRIEYRLLRLAEIFTKSAPNVARRAGRWAKRALTALVDAFLDAAMWGVREIGQTLDMMILKPLRWLGRGIAKIASTLWTPLKDGFKGALNFIIRGWNRLHFTMPEIDTHIPKVGKIGGFDVGVPQIPMLAQGGTITAGGLAIVGENGPEMVSLPSAASVIPLPRLPEFAGQASPTIHTHVYLDRREIALAITSANDSRLARL